MNAKELIDRRLFEVKGIMSRDTVTAFSKDFDGTIRRDDRKVIQYTFPNEAKAKAFYNEVSKKNNSVTRAGKEVSVGFVTLKEK